MGYRRSKYFTLILYSANIDIFNRIANNLKLTGQY